MAPLPPRGSLEQGWGSLLALAGTVLGRGLPGKGCPWQAQETGAPPSQEQPWGGGLVLPHTAQGPRAAAGLAQGGLCATGTWRLDMIAGPCCEGDAGG